LTSGGLEIERPGLSGGAAMSDFPADGLPEDFTYLDYDVFEELPDGSTVWRACVFGIANVQLKFRELRKETGNKLFALNLQDRTLPVIYPLKVPAKQESRRAS
jgi:hypothetical protein